MGTLLLCNETTDRKYTQICTVLQLLYIVNAYMAALCTHACLAHCKGI